MKKHISIVLAGSLLLCGCSSSVVSDKDKASGTKNASEESIVFQDAESFEASLSGCSSSDVSDQDKALGTKNASEESIVFQDAESFEAALNRGEELVGATVTFVVNEVHPDSYYGYDLWAGEHLNFIFSEDQNVQTGDSVTVEVITVNNSATGSWIINDPNNEEHSVANVDFTKSVTLDCITFMVDKDSAEKSVVNGTMYTNGSFAVIVTKPDNSFDLTDDSYDRLELDGVSAVHYGYEADGSFIDYLFVEVSGTMYSFACVSAGLAETNKEMFDKFVRTISIDSAAAVPGRSFEKFTLSGTGSKVISDITLPPVICIVHAEHSGRSNFIVHYYSESGDRSSLANEIGAVNSYQVFDAQKNKSADGGMLEVKADGRWSLTFIPLSEYVSGDEKTSFSGCGNSVIGCFTATGLTVCKGTHSGSSNFIVRIYEYSETGDRLTSAFNEIGYYNGETVLRTEAGKKYFFNVSADGSWTLDIGS
ncbi:MAG: hypothetical protein IJ060_09970 [Oscillospiraceae bacterium]|nr:hypothetical protein [Oscillospiraceae bacterium]MBR1534417.1 hypothetical protein [Ruminococcus sp.]